ncbi:Crp/Fnr family transcriptional regulator [Caldimonas taiwanensis]|uniref:Crp/Fnr family transcriptional regulator n=2 Tax=Sphaerotilaceae TaxID=2975441 RepID=UPI000A05906D|nr:Crp/Fnr family transcriptional regulator [Caldimonas taiwanensis]
MSAFVSSWSALVRSQSSDARLTPWRPGMTAADLRLDELARLQAGAWFGALSESLRCAVLARARVLGVASGTVLARRSSAATDWIGVLRGAVRLGTVLRDGRPFTLDLVGPGQWFGDIALIDGKPNDLDVVAQVPSTLLMVSQTDLRRLTADHPELRDALMILNCQRLRHMFRRFEELHTLPLAQRLARQVLRLARQFGRVGEQEVRIELRISQSDLAAMVGGSRQRVNAALRELQALGLLRLGEARLSVLDMARLQTLADADAQWWMGLSRRGRARAAKPAPAAAGLDELARRWAGVG